MLLACDSRRKHLYVSSVSQARVWLTVLHNVQLLVQHTMYWAGYVEDIEWPGNYVRHEFGLGPTWSYGSYGE
jgi:hypothetical protein